MHATRRLLLATSSSSSSRSGILLPTTENKLLLPPATFWDNIWSAMQGVWSVATDPTQRQAFEDAISSDVIKDGVLQNAYNGSTMTFSLFWNLQNPLWKRSVEKGSSFDAQEFARAVGPALTNLHDFLHSFQNQIRQEFIEYKELQEKNSTSASTDAASAETEAKNDEEEAIVSSSLPIDQHVLEQLLPPTQGEENKQHEHLLNFLKQPHPWRQQAEADPDSLAGRLSRMTTEHYLDGFCLSSKLGLAVTNNAVYEPGSATVSQVAILSARAMEIPLPGQKTDDDDNDHRYEEFKASEESDLKMGVAAQIDVLYEVTNRFHEQVPVFDENDPLGLARKESSIETGSSTSETTPQLRTEHVEYTSLGVAVFEGWLDKGDNDKSGDDNGLRWRVPLMREPLEFPMTVSAMRTVLPPDEEAQRGDDKGLIQPEKPSSVKTDNNKNDKQEDESSASSKEGESK